MPVYLSEANLRDRVCKLLGAQGVDALSAEAVAASIVASERDKQW